jgi:DNA-binding beta-propeller fold protein YncE
MQHDSGVRRPAGELGLRELPFSAAPMVREVLAGIGRTEDVRFSPDNRRLAIATFFRNSITLVDVEITEQAGCPQVALTGAVELSAPGVVWPHGVEFLDDDTLVIASRECRVSTYRLPRSRARRSSTTLTPVGAAADAGYACVVEAGSVRRTVVSDGGFQLMVGDSVQGVLTRHRIDTTAGALRSGAGQVVASIGLGLPDGVAATADGRFVAVSNHDHHCVLVYDCDAGRDPVAVLRGALYPHGLSFTPDDRHLVVADANGPHLVVFGTTTAAWSGVHYPVATLQVMDDETFRRGHHNSLEGGPKGLDIDRTGRVVAVTSQQQPLAFFALDDVLAQAVAPHDDDRRVGYELGVIQEQAGMVTRMVQHERERSGRLRARTEEAEAAAREHAAALRALEQTKTFRFAGPLRRLSGRLRRG